jgi:hypothetical protein
MSKTKLKINSDNAIWYVVFAFAILYCIFIILLIIYNIDTQRNPSRFRSMF